MNKVVYIVILNYRNWEDARDCIISILASDYSNYRILLLDNASGDGSIENLVTWIEGSQLWQKSDQEASEFYSAFDEKTFTHLPLSDLPKISFVQNEKNEGFAAGNNVALQRLVEEDGYVWLLNPDMLIAKDSLGELIRYTSAQTKQVLVGAVLKKFHKPDEVYLYGGGIINWKTATVSFVSRKEDLDQLDYLNGSCIFFEAQHLKTLGLLPTSYFLYWEETEWCFIAKQKGFDIRVCETAVCFDKISATIGKSYLSDFYYTRNGLLFLKKFAPSNIFIASATTLARIAKRVLSGDIKRAKGMLAGLQAFYKMQRNEN